MSVGLAAAVGVLVGVGPSWGAETCVRSVDATAAADAVAAEVALLAAFADAGNDVTNNGCTSWRVELTGTFELTGTIVWERSVPLTVAGPVGSTARLEAVPAAGTGAVTHRILAVDTWPALVVTLERLVLTGGDVSAGTSDNQGGAALAAILHLVDVEMIDNHAVSGGAVSVGMLQAVRTSFVGNTAELLAGTGGAVSAAVSVELENVTLRGNLAKSGGAVHMDLITGTTGGEFDATFVTFLDNESSESTGGADLHLSAAAHVDLPITLRGVLLGGVGSGASSNGPTCAGSRFAADPVSGLTWDVSFATDGSCLGPTGSFITRPTYTTVPFLAGTTDLRVPEGAWEGLDAVDCDANDAAAPAWPAVDQRSLTRPQGEAGLCDVGAVERAYIPEAEEPTEDPVDTTDKTSEPAGGNPSPNDPPAEAEVFVGPIPSSIPAGGGGCSDGCPGLSPRR